MVDTKCDHVLYHRIDDEGRYLSTCILCEARWSGTDSTCPATGRPHWETIEPYGAAHRCKTCGMIDPQ